MSRYVWPYAFTLRAVGLVEAARQRKAAPVHDRFFARSNGLIPIALRWSTSPEIGFPREPFEVFRRARNAEAEKALLKRVAASAALSGQLDIDVFANGDLAFLVMASVAVAAGGSVSLQALDASLRPIPGQTVTLAGSGVAEFRCPGIAALRASGTGTVGPCVAIGETDYANLADWQKIQTVGLPLKADEIGGAYATKPQGFEPPAFDGIQAAELRTEMSALLQLDPPNTGIADFPLPAWPVPNPAAYVGWLRGAKSLVPMIERCLKTSVDSDPAKLQADYTETIDLAGIKQANLPHAKADSTRPSKAKLPIPGVVMMGASTDAFAAVALGYGTVDIPPRFDVPPPPPVLANPVHVLPSPDSFGQWDYMVTAPYTFPFMSLTLAALSAGQAPVEAPAGLAAKVKQVHAPVKRNQPTPAVITVSWLPSLIPQGYGVLASRAANQSEVLNAARDPGVKGYDPFVGIAPVNPDPNTPPDQQIPSFSDTGCALPLSAPPSNERYLVAGLDVFGQWSAWVPANTSLQPSPVTKPGVSNVEFLMDPAGAVGHVVPATIRIDFVWNWEDRSPGQIRFTGNFVAPGAGLGPAPFLGGFAMQNSGAVGAPVLLTFTYAPASQADTVTPPIGLIPTIDAGHATAGPVQILQPSPNANGSQVRYRVDIKGVKLDFTTVNEIDFALYATATESIRPGQFSDATDPVTKFVGKIAKAFDPLPPAVHFTPPSISWTALPDASGMARGILDWTPDPKATGYYVWEATESALLHLLQPPNTPDPPPSTPLVTRGATLKSLINANEDRSLQAFARLNKDPITGARTEVNLPASASTLYVYRISAITGANVECSRSAQVAIFGVPRRNVPGTPRLLLRSSKPPLPAGIQVIGLPVESGAPPAGYRAFRVRNPTLSLDGSTMGPAKMDEANPGWQPYAGTTLAGNPVAGRFIVDTAATPSWYPYYYRIKAVGIQDPTNGRFAGESDFSGVQSATILPAGPPLIGVFTLTTNVNAALVTLTTDLPAAKKSPAGPALVEVLQMIADPAHPGRMTTKVILTKAPEQITAGTLKLPLPVVPPPPPPHIPPFPIPRPLPPPVPVPALARSAPDTNGHWQLYVLIPYPAAGKGSFMVRLTDPLSRNATNSF